MTVQVQGKIHSIGDIEYADGGVVRGVLIAMHFDDVRTVATAGLLFKDVQVTIADSAQDCADAGSATPGGER